MPDGERYLQASSNADFTLPTFLAMYMTSPRLQRLDLSCGYYDRDVVSLQFLISPALIRLLVASGSSLSLRKVGLSGCRLSQSGNRDLFRTISKGHRLEIHLADIWLTEWTWRERLDFLRGESEGDLTLHVCSGLGTSSALWPRSIKGHGRGNFRWAGMIGPVGPRCTLGA